MTADGTTTMEDLSGISVEKKGNLKFAHGLPGCPTCKTVKNMIFSNVTEKIYECLRCKVRFRVAE